MTRKRILPSLNILANLLIDEKQQKRQKHTVHDIKYIAPKTTAHNNSHGTRKCHIRSSLGQKKCKLPAYTFIAGRSSKTVA